MKHPKRNTIILLLVAVLLCAPCTQAEDNPWLEVSEQEVREFFYKLGIEPYFFRPDADSDFSLQSIRVTRGEYTVLNQLLEENEELTAQLWHDYEKTIGTFCFVYDIANMDGNIATVSLHLGRTFTDGSGSTWNIFNRRILDNDLEVVTVTEKSKYSIVSRLTLFISDDLYGEKSTVARIILRYRAQSFSAIDVDGLLEISSMLRQ